MSHQMTSLAEFFFANRANIGFLTSMDTFMSGQTTFLSEFFFANPAYVEFLTSMDSFMAFQMILCLKSLIAWDRRPSSLDHVITYKRSFIGVDSLMSRVSPSTWEIFFATIRTHTTFFDFWAFLFKLFMNCAATRLNFCFFFA
jgi:hypothetical protein